MSKRSILITCPKGLPAILANEVAALGYEVTENLPAGIGIKGTFQDTMRLNLHLRTAHRVHLLLEQFKAESPDALYRGAKEISWERVLLPDGYVSIHAFTATNAVNNSRFASQRLKDAIVDRMRAKTGRRPDSGPDKSRSVVFLHWQDNHCQVWLDTSGEPLIRRGYRKMPHKAPMQETLAAGVVLASRFQPGHHFVNPMCGSGVLATEALLIAQNRAPGLLRRNFGFMHVVGYDAGVFEKMREQAQKAILPAPKGRFIATDQDPVAIQAARTNAAEAGLEGGIEFDVCDFRETHVPEGEGVVVVNPEYGLRMGDEHELEPVYKAIGDFFKQDCGGKTGYIFTGNMALGKKVGLRTKRKIPFFTSKIECRLLEYELYAGSRS